MIISPTKNRAGMTANFGIHSDIGQPYLIETAPMTAKIRKPTAAVPAVQPERPPAFHPTWFSA